jgi:2-dehydro-3-deoxyphosphooctonate aldolase (KDO 8-P synthase)
MNVVTEVPIRDGVVVGAGQLVLLCGPCVVEGRDVTFRIAEGVRAAAESAGLPVVFKASFDKANRTSIEGFRGIGADEALRVLEQVRDLTGMPVLTDIHEVAQVEAVAQVVDVLQIPAFLCRQTDLLVAAGTTAKPVNIKKGQFMAPADMRHAVDKVRQGGGGGGVMLTERGTSFGYGDLVVDMRSLPVLRGLGCPVVFDATHAVQRPSAAGDRSGGDRAMVPVLLRAAVAVGVDAVFLETHEDPDRALSDGPNSVPLAVLPRLLEQVRLLAEFSNALPVVKMPPCR